jgi:hypothetical protein
MRIRHCQSAAAGIQLGFVRRDQVRRQGERAGTIGAAAVLL